MQHKLFCIMMIFFGIATILHAQAQNSAPEASLTSFAAGAMVVQKPAEYNADTWSAFWILDERGDTGWASPEGQLKNHVFIIQLAEKTLLKRLEFDTGKADGEKRGAKDITIEVSDTSATAGFKKIASVSLADRVDKQSFTVSAQVPGRWVKLTILNNNGAEDYTELMDFRGYGQQLTKTPFSNVSGTYESNYNDFHLRQEGNTVTGCYEHAEGVLNGGIEGRTMKFTWRQTNSQGPAIMIFTPDAKKFLGLWWYEGSTDERGGIWNGTRKSAEVGSCPHWSGNAQKEFAHDLTQYGRVRLYGINFDTDLAVIRPESKSTLDQIIALLKSNKDMKITIEGHTDSTGTDAHNQKLSQQRADAVKAYLVTSGIEAERLKTAGFGATKPVADNKTALGRAQNRRVELVRN